MTDDDLIKKEAEDSEDGYSQVSTPRTLIPLLKDYIDTERQRALNTLQIEMRRIEAQQQIRSQEESRFSREVDYNRDYRLAALQEKARARRDYLYAGFAAILILSAVFLMTLYWNKEAVFIEWGKAIIYLVGLILTFFAGKAYGQRSKNGDNRKNDPGD